RGQFSRALHVVEENHRVLASTQALRTGQLTELAVLLAQGHESLAELFEVTVPATDALVAIAKDALGNRVAARQTGGGFGGAVVCICGHDDVELLLAAVQQHYHQQTGLEATPFVCTPGRGLECVIHE
ncbi:MAG: galactokinase, partial [Luminiphilus sp.]